MKNKLIETNICALMAAVRQSILLPLLPRSFVSETQRNYSPALV